MKKCLYIIVLFTRIAAFSQETKVTPSSMFREDAAHSGVYPGKGFRKFGDTKWTFLTGGKIFSSPAFLEGTIYVGSGDSCLYAVDANTGQLKWKHRTGGAIHSTPAVCKNTVYFGCFDGYFYAVNAVTGKQVWKFRTGGEKKVGAVGLWTMQPKDSYMEDLYDFFLSSPIIDPEDKNPLIYFGSSDGNVYALNAGNGDLAWKFSTQGIIHSSPALVNGIVYIGSWDTYMYALDARTGELKWKYKTGDQPVYHLMEGIQGSPAYYRGMIYFGARDGFFYGLDAITGKLIWKYSANGSWIITTSAAKDGVVYFGTSDTYFLVAADAKSGKELYHFKAKGYVYSSPSIAGNTAYFGDFTGKLYALDLSDSGRSADVYLTAGGKLNGARVLNAKGELDFDYVAAGDSSIYYSTSKKVMNILYTLGPIVSSPVITDDMIYFGCADGSLYAVKLHKG